MRPPVNLLVSAVMKRALESVKVLELSTLKLTGLERVFFLPIVTVALYWPSALMAVATVVIFHEPLLVEVALSGVAFQATPSNELITTLALAAGLT